MINRLIKLIIIVSCIPLLSSCAEAVVVAGVGVYVTQIAVDAKKERSLSFGNGFFFVSHSMQSKGQDDVLDATYEKDFSIPIDLNNKSDSNDYYNLTNLQLIPIQVSYNCQKIKTTLNRTTTFLIKFSKTSSFNTTELIFLNSSQTTNSNYVPVIKYPFFYLTFYPKSGTKEIYSLEEALNYQWCKGEVYFANKHKNNITNIVNNTNIIYNININIFSNTRKCSKWFGAGECLSLHYKYDINIIDEKTKTIYFSKNIEHTENTSYTTGDMEYNARGSYILPIVEKNREVIEEEVFTDELYNALTSASQNSAIN